MNFSATMLRLAMAQHTTQPVPASATCLALALVVIIVVLAQCGEDRKP